MRKLLMLAACALPMTAQANYYDGRGNYVITPAPSYTVFTPNGTWTASPNNPVQPNGGYTIYGPSTSSVPMIVAPAPYHQQSGPTVDTNAFMAHQQREWEAKHCHPAWGGGTECH